MLKDYDRQLRLVFLTGVSKFSKAGLFSGLNNLSDITLDPRFGTICGYTEVMYQIMCQPRKGVLPVVRRKFH